MRDRAGTIRVTNDIVMSASVFETRYSSQSAHPTSSKLYKWCLINVRLILLYRYAVSS